VILRTYLKYHVLLELLNFRREIVSLGIEIILFLHNLFHAIQVGRKQILLSQILRAREMVDSLVVFHPPDMLIRDISIHPIEINFLSRF
jgi:hypothetical protein